MSELSTGVEDRNDVVRELRLLNERKDQFISILAHELRSPLAPIANAVDVLTTSRDDPRAVPYACDIIRRQLWLLNRLVEDLFDSSCIAHGVVELTRRPVDLVTVLTTAVEAVQPLIERRSQKLTSRLPQQPVILNADAVRLAQVFTNLLHNAAKYTDMGGCIGLSLDCSQDGVVVRVRDSGIGIEADALPLIFELFVRVTPKSGSNTTGLGIGLCLARQLVELHGGTITAHSDGAGRGSEFVVRLPFEPRG